MDTRIFCENPKAVFPFKWLEGFGATIYSLLTRIEYCLKQQYYFSVAQPLGFGYWTDFFKPFWDPIERKKVYRTTTQLMSPSPKIVIYREHVMGYKNKNGTNLFYLRDFKYITHLTVNLMLHLKFELKYAVQQTPS